MAHDELMLEPHNVEIDNLMKLREQDRQDHLRMHNENRALNQETRDLLKETNQNVLRLIGLTGNGKTEGVLHLSDSLRRIE